MDIPGFYFCLCPDALLAREHMEEMLLQMPNWAKADRLTFWGDDGLNEQFWNALTLQSFSVVPRLLIVRNAQNLPAVVWKKLSSVLSAPHSLVLPVFFLEGAWEKGAPKIPAHISKLKCFEFASKRKWEFRSIGLNEKNVRRFLETEAGKAGLSFESGALDSLASSINPDAASIRGVLAQLSLLCPEGKIDRNAASQLTAYTPELMIFELVRDVQAGNSVKVWRTVQGESDADALLFPLLALMARETRTLWQLMMGENVYIPPAAMAGKRHAVQKLGVTGLVESFRLIMEAEMSIKSGAVSSSRQVLERFIADFLDLYSR